MIFKLLCAVEKEDGVRKLLLLLPFPVFDLPVANIPVLSDSETAPRDARSLSCVIHLTYHHPLCHHREKEKKKNRRRRRHRSRLTRP